MRFYFKLVHTVQFSLDHDTIWLVGGGAVMLR